MENSPREYILLPEYAKKSHEDLAKILKLIYEKPGIPGNQQGYFYCQPDEAVCKTCKQMVAIRDGDTKILEVPPSIPNAVRSRIEKIAQCE